MTTRHTRRTLIALLAVTGIAIAAPSHVVLDAGGGAAPAAISTIAASAPATPTGTQAVAHGMQRLTEFDHHPYWRGLAPIVSHAAASTER